MRFLYEVKEGGARILRCFSGDGTVEIPEEVDGYPIKELGAYAFSGHFDEAGLRGRETRLSQGFFSEQEALCGERLTEIRIGKTVESVGAYCFYNCIRLRRLSFSSGVASFGQGAFTGCSRLDHLEYRQNRGQKPCLKEVLGELPGQLEVEYREGADYARLMFPEYYEEGVENTPARILMTQVHGSGLYYRNCFRQRQLQFAEYDQQFPKAVPVESEEFLSRLVVGRLRYPYQLQEKSRLAYESYLRAHQRRISLDILKEQDILGIQWLAEGYLEKKEEIDWLIEEVNRQGGGQILAWLMDFRHRKWGRATMRPRFEL